MKSDEKKCPACAEVIKKDAAVCKHCGHRFSEEEVAASRAEMKKNKQIGCVVVILLLFGVGYCTTKLPPPSTSTNADTASAGADSTASGNESASAATSKWRYSENKDSMRGRTDRFAEVESDNEQQFNFPYNGGSKVTVQVRRYQKDSTEALLTIDKGQWVCQSFTGGTVAVKFDDGPIKKYRCSDTSDGDTSTIFITPAAGFVAGLKGSKRMMIEAPFFQEGNRQFMFTTAGLDWK